MASKSCRILFFFQFLALFVVTVKTTSREKSRIFLTIFYIIIAIFTLTIALAYKEMIFDVRTTLGAILDITQLAIPVVTQIIGLVEGYRKRRIFHKIWQKIAIIEGLLEEIPGRYGDIFEKIYRKFFIKFLLFNCGAIFIEILIIVRLRENYPWHRHRIAAFLPSLVTRSLVFLYILHVDIAGGVFNAVTGILRGITESPKILPLHRRTTKICWKISRELWLLESFVGKAFTLSIPAIIFSYSGLLTVNFYWNFKAFFRSSTIYVVESSLCSTPFILTLVPLVFAGEECKKKRKRIFVEILTIAPMCAPMATFGKFLRNFTISGLQTSIGAWEFLDIDMRLLSEISQIIGIYLTIFIQFEITYYAKYATDYVYIEDEN